jgi:hypothetical protein
MGVFMTKRQLFPILFALLTVVLLSCGPKIPEPSYTKGTARIGVSDAAYEISAYVAQQYQQIHKSAFVSVYRNDTQSLLDSLINDRVEEILIDRALSPEETLAFSQRQLKLWVYPVAYYPVFLLVDTSLGVTAIDSVGFRNALTGVTTNWKALGGPDIAMTPYIPLPGTEAWTSLMNYYGELDSITAVACSTDAKMLELSANDRGALLLFSHDISELPGYRKLRWAQGELRIPANVKSILELPRYPFMLQFTYVTTRNKIDVASGYLTFIVGNDGQKMVMKEGYRPASVPVRVVQLKEE